MLPLVFATGAGAVARKTIGFTVLGGMISASSLAIFIVPVLFVVIIRIAYGKKHLESLAHKIVETESQVPDEGLNGIK